LGRRSAAAPAAVARAGLAEEYSGLQQVESAEARLISFKETLRNPDSIGRPRGGFRLALGTCAATGRWSRSMTIPAIGIPPGEQSQAKTKTKAAIADLSKLIVMV